MHDFLLYPSKVISFFICQGSGGGCLGRREFMYAPLKIRETKNFVWSYFKLVMIIQIEYLILNRFCKD